MVHVKYKNYSLRMRNKVFIWKKTRKFIDPKISDAFHVGIVIL